MFAGTVLADPTGNRASKREQKVEERTVFVTGSLIPQRVKLLADRHQDGLADSNY